MDETAGPVIVPLAQPYRQMVLGATDVASILQAQAQELQNFVAQAQEWQANAQLRANGQLGTLTMEGPDGGGFFGPMGLSFAPEDLGLELSSVTTNTGVFIVHPPEAEARSGVYDLFMTTNLAAAVPGLNLTNWYWVLRTQPGETNLLLTAMPNEQAFFRLGRTNDTDGDGLTDAFEQLLSHTDPYNPDQNANGIPDGWEWTYFGNLDQPADGDYDNDGVSNLQEYQDGSDPNDIRFRVMTHARFSNNPELPVQLEVFGGVPSQMAVLTNMAFASAVWRPYSSNFTLSLGPTDGRYDIWVALKARAPGSPTNWDSIAVNLDRTPPAIFITSPAPGSTLSMPYIQVQGYSPKPIHALQFDVTNAAGLRTDGNTILTDQNYDTNCYCFTTNSFKLIDVDLTNGLNTVIVRATDLAGNSSTNSFTFTLDLASDAVPPAVTLYWPQDGDTLSGTNFTLRGLLDDPTAKVTVQITNASGASNANAALIERNGLLWAEDLPLGEGTNTVVLTATDAAGNAATTNITVYQSAVGLTVDDVPRERLWDWTITVTGTIDSEGYTVWVNGMRATNNGDGTWVASGVQLNEGNTAVIQARAIPNADNGGNGTGGGAGARPTYQNPGNPSSPGAVQNEGGKGKDFRVYIDHHNQEWTYNQHIHDDFYLNEGGVPGEQFDWGDADWREKAGHDWRDGKGGNGWWSRLQVNLQQGGGAATNDCRATIVWPATFYEALVSGVWDGNPECIQPRFPEYVPCIPMEHCDITNTYDWKSLPTMILDPFHPYYGEFVVRTIHQDSSRRADSIVMVFTGEKDTNHPNRQSVLELKVPVSEITNASISCGLPGEAPVPAAKVSIGEVGEPNTDYTVYKKTGRGNTLNATVTAPPNRFTYTVSGGMHDLAIQCACDVPKERERTTVGVGEYVSMSFTQALAWHPPRWGHIGGGLSVDPYTPADAVTYTASSNATSDKVMANFPAPRGKFVTLTTEFTVLAPTGYDPSTAATNGQCFPANRIGASGMYIRVVMAPTNVSFSRVTIYEVGQPASGQTGWYANHSAPSHVNNGADQPIGLGCDNSWADHAWSEQISWLAPGWSLANPGGSFTWLVPVDWQVEDGPKHRINGWAQNFVLSPDGTVKVEKFGYSATRSPGQNCSILRRETP